MFKFLTDSFQCKFDSFKRFPNWSSCSLKAFVPSIEVRTCLLKLSKRSVSAFSQAWQRRSLSLKLFSSFSAAARSLASISFMLPLDRLVGSAVPATQKIYDYFKNMGTGFWLPGRQPIAFAPWIYTPLNSELYKRNPRFSINFNDEAILSLTRMK